MTEVEPISWSRSKFWMKFVIPSGLAETINSEETWNEVDSGLESDFKKIGPTALETDTKKPKKTYQVIENYYKSLGLRTYPKRIKPEIKVDQEEKG